MTRTLPWTLVCAVLPLLAACGGGGGAAAPTVDMTGYWQVYLTPAGAPAETGPSAVYIAQNGAVLSGAGIAGTVAANAFTMTTNAGVFVASFTGIASTNAANGTMSLTGLINATGTFRLARFQPTGTLTVNGTIGADPIALTTTTAAGGRDYGDTMLTMLEEVEVVGADAQQHLEIDLLAAGLALGTRNLPADVDATVTWRRGADITESDVTSGTLTVTQYDAGGFAGSFTFTLQAGGSITGSFAVAYDIESYDP